MLKLKSFKFKIKLLNSKSLKDKSQSLLNLLGTGLCPVTPRWISPHLSISSPKRRSGGGYCFKISAHGAQKTGKTT
jgi:hypothetical protein